MPVSLNIYGNELAVSDDYMQNEEKMCIGVIVDIIQLF